MGNRRGPEIGPSGGRRTAVRALEATGSAAAGAGIGVGAVTASGLTAAGMVGSGTGIGAAAGPVGAAAGALVGLAFYGVFRVFKH